MSKGKAVYSNSRVMLTHAVKHWASPHSQFQIVLLEFPLTVIPIVSGSLGPRVGQLATAATATMANVCVFLLTLKEVERCLLCSSNSCVKARRLKHKEGDGENYVIY